MLISFLPAFVCIHGMPLFSLIAIDSSYFGVTRVTTRPGNYNIKRDPVSSRHILYHHLMFYLQFTFLKINAEVKVHKRHYDSPSK